MSKIGKIHELRIKNIVFFFFLFLVGYQNVSANEQDNVNRRIAAVTTIFSNGNIERALTLSKKLVNEYPKNGSAHGLLGGMILEKARKIDKDSSERAEEVHSGLAELRTALELQGESNQIERDFKATLGMSYGSFLSEFKMIDEALIAFRHYYDSNVKFANTTPHLRHIVVIYAEALAEKGMVADASEKYNEAISINNIDPTLAKEYIKFAAKYVNLEKAIILAGGFEDDVGFNSGVRYEKCHAFYSHNKFKKSVNCFEKLLLKIPSNNPYYKSSNELLDKSKK